MTETSHGAIALRFAEMLRDLERNQPSDTESALRELTKNAAALLPRGDLRGHHRRDPRRHRHDGGRF